MPGIFPALVVQGKCNVQLFQNISHSPPNGRSSYHIRRVQKTVQSSFLPDLSNLKSSYFNWDVMRDNTFFNVFMCTTMACYFETSKPPHQAPPKQKWRQANLKQAALVSNSMFGWSFLIIYNITH